MAAAYFDFAERYFDRFEPVNASLIAHVLTTLGIRGALAAAVSDATLDEFVEHRDIGRDKTRSVKPRLARFCGVTDLRSSGRS